LAAEEWTIIDLTLSQFGLPTTDTWSGTKDGYVVQMAKNADDATVTGLAEHCVLEADYFRLFLSRLATHKKFAGEVPGIGALWNHGVRSPPGH
jgi:hypothetical protein